jgi:hypothetical protein
MKRMIAACMLLGTLSVFSGCRTITAVSPTGEAGKVFVTKTTTYFVFVQNKVQSCTINGLSVTNCEDVTVE